MTASPAASAPRGYLSIGEVLSALRSDFPDVTISKIRFLEAEGLLRPERTRSGYRKFSRDDVSRLRYVLESQRDKYLPLRVIKEHLDAMDRGLLPPDTPGGAPRLPHLRSAADASGGPAPDAQPVRLSRSELLATAGLTDEQLDRLEQFGLIGARSGHYDQTALGIAQAVADMARYGIEPRHLRVYRTAADREIGLFEQVITPLVRQRGPEAHGRAAETVDELAAISVRLHAALLKAGLRHVLS